MDLILVRHAIAFERDTSRWPDDRDRPLTADGESKFRRAARGLGRLVNTVDVVLCSPLTRAWQTAELLEEEAGWPKPEPFPALEPDRTAAEATQALATFADRETVAAVGHEPLLGEIIAQLLTGSSENGAFALKKGGAASVAFEGDGPNVLRWLVTPKIERALRS